MMPPRRALLRRLIPLIVALVTAHGRGTARAQPFDPREPGATLEYQVKAAFLLNFLAFTEWPSGALPTAGSPVRICVAGSDPFGGALDGTVQGETVLEHPIAVERIARAADARRCHALFISRQAGPATDDFLHAVDGVPVMTVGESPTFLQAGGIVNFVIDQGHVRFDVNRGLAEQRGLRFSSRLLRLARRVM
jgi:hypothetical protein